MSKVFRTGLRPVDMLGCMLRKLSVLLFLCLSSALAQQVAGLELFGVRHFSVNDLARGLNTAATRIGNSVVVRTDFGILTLWTGEREYLWLPAGEQEPAQRRLSAPVTEAGGELWAPLDLLHDLGASISGVVLVLPDRTRLVLAGEAAQEPVPVLGERPAAAAGDSQVIELANGVLALRMTAGGQSLLLVDLGLLGLAYPERRSDFDSFNAGLEGQRPLYFVLSASEPGLADLSFLIRQPGVNSRLDPADGVVIVQGEPSALGPGSSLSGVLLLPAATNLRGNLQVQWQQVTADMIFRR